VGNFLAETLSARNWDCGEDVSQDAVGVEALQFCLGLEADAMTQDGRQGAFYVIWNEVAAVFEGGYGLGYAHQA
jgi:hypothetical protein